MRMSSRLNNSVYKWKSRCQSRRPQIRFPLTPPAPGLYLLTWQFAE